MTGPLTDPRAREAEIGRLRAEAERCWKTGGALHQAGFHTITGEERALLLLNEADRLETEAKETGDE